MPRPIGYQDLAALQARQPEAIQRARAALVSPFGTIHAATFSLPRPVGTLIPEPPVRLATLAPGDLGITGAIGPAHRPRREFPAVNRRLKGDLLVARPRQQPLHNEPSRDLTPGRIKTVSFPKPAETPPSQAVAPSVTLTPMAEPAVVPDVVSPPTEAALEQAASDPAMAVVTPVPLLPNAVESSSQVTPPHHSNSGMRIDRLYFGSGPVGEAVGAIQPWPMGEELLIQSPSIHDPEIKRSAVAPDSREGAAAGNETIAGKGEVTGPDKRPKTPAERLGLDAKGRTKAEKCLAEAVYFESRGEAKRGQIAVAQVVMNRVFSGFYPNNVCGVVYQNAHRKLACQFTFACDNVPEVVNEPVMWRQAKQIARDMLDGKLWLPEVGHSTHYHAYWVHPAWVREMRRMQKIGVHSFYRPRAWGDGSDAQPLGQPEEKGPEKAKL